MPDSTSLEGRTAIVTGASSGIGRAIAEHLGDAGAYVFLAGRTVSSMETFKKNIEERGGNARVIKADVRDIAQVTGLIEAAVESTGRLDVMVNNAGLEFPASIMAGNFEHRTGRSCRLSSAGATVLELKDRVPHPR